MGLAWDWGGEEKADGLEAAQEPGPGMDSVPAGGERDVEGMRQEGRGHRQGRAGGGLGRQRDRKKGINQHRLHSGNVGEASIKRAPFPGPGRLSPYPSTSFSYLLPPQLSLDPSEGLPTLMDRPSKPRACSCSS